MCMLQVLLACTDQAAWETLARRRVCHFGYKFEYKVCTICNVIVLCGCMCIAAAVKLCLQRFATAVQKCGSAASHATVSSSIAGNCAPITCASGHATGLLLDFHDCAMLLDFAATQGSTLSIYNVQDSRYDAVVFPQVDQCTVNEYPAGVGLSPHTDTHSAFSGDTCRTATP